MGPPEVEELTRDHRWLVAALGSGLTAFFAVAGCTRATVLASELLDGPLAAARGLDLEAEPPPPVERLHLTSRVSQTVLLPSVEPIADDLDEADRPAPMNGLCPAEMVSIDDRFCIDKYEASLVEVLPDGDERPFPYFMRVDGHDVRAVSVQGVYPQGYISGREAAAACRASGKRLCKPQEWRTACKGPEGLQYGYANERSPGTCNDRGRSPIGVLFRAQIRDGTAYSSSKIMNDPELNQVPGTLAETGAHDECTNGYGVHDMVGNIHEWVDDPAGTFQGGYYLDVQQNGEGCGYRTDAHAVWYHDYSTGFRCCADIPQ